MTHRFHRLSSVSPSRLSGLRQCAAREIWAATGDPLLPVSPAAALGSAIHRLLQEAGEGRLLTAPSINQRWAELIAEAEGRMMQHSIQKQFVPLASSVAHFEVRSIQAMRRAEEITSERQTITPAAEESADGYGHELEVSAADGRVRGVIDAVLPGRNGPIIRDYKSGSLLTPEDELKSEYTDQLVLYAALYHATFGTWPAKLELVPLHGDSVRVSFTHEQAAASLLEAVALYEWVNSQLDDADRMPRALMRPSPSTCHFCGFRPACAGYLAARNPQEGTWPADVIGSVERVQMLKNGTYLVQVSDSARAVRVRGISPSQDRHPYVSGLRVGRSAGLFSVRGPADGTSFEQGAFTCVYPLNSRDG